MKSVLFIDTRNATRSQIAEAWFNRLARGIGQADSCGTMPANAIDPRVVQVMSEMGIRLRGKRPKGVWQQTLAQAELIVLMGKDVNPSAFSANDIWDYEENPDWSFEQIRLLRDQIRPRVQRLLAHLRPEVHELAALLINTQSPSLRVEHDSDLDRGR
jgi:arsenate reductase (thioredoxin)